MSIEVEIRSFISEAQYNQLLDFFKQNAVIVKEDFQETHYFNCPEDLRIQKSNSRAKIWVKKGNIHDEAREEIEIIINKEDFEKIANVFKNLGYDVEIKWLRDRKQFDWNGIKVCLDYTKGYGHIIELEQQCTEEEKERTLENLKEKLNELNISLTPKEVFDETFRYYKENWRRLIENELDREI